MNFDLQDPIMYSDLKAWMLENFEQMPNTMDSGHIYYLDVKSTINILIERIDKRIEVLGNGVKSDLISKSAKNSLETLYHNLQVKENWNKPLRKLIDEFKNSNQ